MAHSWTSEFGGGLETIRLFHHLWYGVDYVPVLTINWVRVLGFLYQSMKEVKAGSEGFKVDDPSMLRADGKILTVKLEHCVGDVSVFMLVDRLFGYENNSNRHRGS